MKKITAPFRHFSAKVASVILIGGLLLASCEKQIQAPDFDTYNGMHSSDVSALSKTNMPKPISWPDTVKSSLQQKTQNASALGKTKAPSPIF